MQRGLVMCVCCTGQLTREPLPCQAPPGFCNRGKVRYGSIGGLEYEVLQSRLYCLCINVALCSTALQCIMKKFHDNESTHILHNFWTSTHRGSFPLSPLAAPLVVCYECIELCNDISLQRGRFCARSLASCIPRSSEDRSS